MKRILIFLFFFQCLHAGWDPNLVPIKDQNCDKILLSSKYAKLKKEVGKISTSQWCSEEKIELLMDLTILLQPSLCVEVGVFKGHSAFPVAIALKLLNKGTLIAIDAWSNKEAIRYLDRSDCNIPLWSTVDMKNARKSFQKKIKEWSLENCCTIMQKTSQQAIDDIPNGIDFLHIDGDYSEIGALQDATLYLPKVKPGGYILLSGFYTMVDRKQPKVKAFLALLESCEIITTIDNDNAVLFRKNEEEN